MIIKCETCGIDVVAKIASKKFCDSCYKAREATRLAKWEKKNRVQRTERQRRANWSRESVLRKYGLTQKDYDVLMERQDGVCAICSNPPPEGKRLHIDHCHQTGKVRGLLCIGCNWAIGHLGDNARGVIRAFVYLLLRSP